MDIGRIAEATSVLPEPVDVDMQQGSDTPARSAEAPSAEAVVPSVSEDAVVPREMNNGPSVKRGRHI